MFPDIKGILAGKRIKERFLSNIRLYFFKKESRHSALLRI